MLNVFVKPPIEACRDLIVKSPVGGRRYCHIDVHHDEANQIHMMADKVGVAAERHILKLKDSKKSWLGCGEYGKTPYADQFVHAVSEAAGQRRKEWTICSVEIRLPRLPIRPHDPATEAGLAGIISKTQ